VRSRAPRARIMRARAALLAAAALFCLAATALAAPPQLQARPRRCVTHACAACAPARARQPRPGLGAAQARNSACADTDGCAVRCALRCPCRRSTLSIAAPTIASCWTPPRGCAQRARACVAQCACMRTLTGVAPRCRCVPTPSQNYYFHNLLDNSVAWADPRGPGRRSPRVVLSPADRLRRLAVVLLPLAALGVRGRPTRMHARRASRVKALTWAPARRVVGGVCCAHLLSAQALPRAAAPHAGTQAAPPGHGALQSAPARPEPDEPGRLRHSGATRFSCMRALGLCALTRRLPAHRQGRAVLQLARGGAGSGRHTRTRCNDPTTTHHNMTNQLHANSSVAVRAIHTANTARGAAPSAPPRLARQSSRSALAALPPRHRTRSSSLARRCRAVS
jgi:hypothetical protein